MKITPYLFTCLIQVQIKIKCRNEKLFVYNKHYTSHSHYHIKYWGVCGTFFTTVDLALLLKTPAVAKVKVGGKKLCPFQIWFFWYCGCIDLLLLNIPWPPFHTKKEGELKWAKKGKEKTKHRRCGGGWGEGGGERGRERREEKRKGGQFMTWSGMFSPRPREPVGISHAATPDTPTKTSCQSPTARVLGHRQGCLHGCLTENHASRTWRAAKLLDAVEQELTTWRPQTGRPGAGWRCGGRGGVFA